MSLLTKTAPRREPVSPDIFARLVFSLLAGILLGALIAALGPGAFLNGWLAAAILSGASIFLLISAWRWGGSGRRLAWMITAAFIIRLAVGIGLSMALPQWGYFEPEQQAGYLFKDAHYRDLQAWDLAETESPLWVTFSEEFATDQYGGLLALSAFVYRYLSPDAHRPFLIILLGAAVAALGTPFLYAAVRLRWPRRVAVIAAWVYVLYPDAIFFASAQMREPFLVGLGAVAFWAVLAWQPRLFDSWLALLISLIGMLVISSRVAAAVGGFLALLFLLEHVITLNDRRWKVLGWLALAGGLALVLLFSWEWFRGSSGYDAMLTLRNSGQVAVRIKEIGEQWVLPFVIVYGLAQPVLPAAIADSSLPLWHTIAIIRAAGWYALAPFLVYSLLFFWRESDARKRRIVFWLVLAVFTWLVIAAARGGGDTTDNPRYRSLFIPWMALLAAWAVDWALVHRDAWLWRWITVEGIFLAFFTHWYLGRYFRLWTRLPFWTMTILIVASSAVVLAGGWAWDRWREKRYPKQSLPE